MFDKEDQDGITLLRMQHGKANAMDVEFCRQFVIALEALDTPATQALVITGSGDIFSAGVDLPRLLDGGAAYAQEFLPALSRLLAAVFAFPKPVVAAINGHAIAGGCVLACACDRRLMVEGRGRIGVPELLVGVPFPAEALEVMRAAVRPPHFSHIVTSGALHEPEAALERGLVDEIVARGPLIECAIKAGRDMAGVGGELFRLTKAQMRQPAMDRIASARRFSDAVADLWASPETFARIRGYVEKTFKPKK